ncbi:ORF118 [Plodia interpunctella granulovirus]|uniref:ORF118 n=1 Tax=Plodia interpunctella granulovirus TaxID=262175 RepID=A0A1L5JGT7_9BBAC|nr:ORF118 [Plodia interpunctella granulovirus]APO14002.1 ORF118 [Plodia interpunctella granulovirus]
MFEFTATAESSSNYEVNRDGVRKLKKRRSFTDGVAAVAKQVKRRFSFNNNNGAKPPSPSPSSVPLPPSPPEPMIGLGNDRKIFVARAPKFSSSSLMTIQKELNEFLPTIDVHKTVYNFIGNTGGNRVIGYTLLVKTLIVEKVHLNEPIFLELCNHLKTLYLDWSRVLYRLHPLMTNLNGADVTKEMMIVINEHAYALVKFVVNNVMNGYATPSFEDLATPDVEDEKYSMVIENTQFYLDNVYNLQLSGLDLAKKYIYPPPKITPYKNIPGGVLMDTNNKRINVEEIHPIV